jgi:large subunit ribosomal protein L22
MAFGVKTNERAGTKTGARASEGPGVRAQARYVRVSPYKAREVLDLIRGEHVGRALEILEFSERDVARPVLKCLESAVANAEHNNGIPADELTVSACFADEGPTLKRFRPRARGRAGRIRKRTSHITVIVSRLSADELEQLREREVSSGRARGNRAASEARRERVARSRQAKAEKKAAEEEAEHDHEHEHEHEHDEVTAGDAEVAADAEGAADTPAAEVDEVADDTVEAPTAEAAEADAGDADTEKPDTGKQDD